MTRSGLLPGGAARRSLGAGRPLRRLVGLGALSAALWLGGLVWFAEQVAAPVADGITRTDAIVVLTGGSDRLSTGFRLLADDRADKLFVSGVHRDVLVADLVDRGRLGPAELACCVVLGYRARDTVGNARESAQWVRQEGFASLRLVTANYHMPRSLMEFRRALPGVRIVPHPVAPATVRMERWWRWPGTASLLATEYSKYLVGVVLGAVLPPRALPGEPAEAPTAAAGERAVAPVSGLLG